MKRTSYVWGAITLLSGIALLASGSASAQGSRTDALIEEAVAHWAALRADETEETLERARQMSPDDPAVLSVIGTLRRYTGDYAESVRLHKKALDLDPENVAQIYQLGITLRYARDLDGSVVAFKNAIALNPAAANAHAQLAFTEIVRGNRDQAVRQLQVAEQLFGEDIPAWRLAQMAFAHAQLGRRNDVMRLFSALEEKEDPVDDAVWAMAYLAVGDYGEALERIQAATDDPGANGGITVQILAQIAANEYRDPALEGPSFQEAFRGMWATTS